MNILTGETVILRSDVIYDCGQSLNPAVDLGQVNFSSILIVLLEDSAYNILYPFLNSCITLTFAQSTYRSL